MSNLFVVAYDDVATANQVRDKVVTLSRQHLIDLEDVVVVERRESDGKIKLHQGMNLTAAGATGGALWGGLDRDALPRAAARRGRRSRGGRGGRSRQRRRGERRLHARGQPEPPPGSAALFALASRKRSTR